ncbi:MAG: molybdate ABC transporter substrate-binding protein [Tetrasphaera sp.]
MPDPRRIAVLIGMPLAALALAACGSDTEPAASSSSSSSGGSAAPASGNLTVFAAASLQESFTTIGKNFEAAHPGSTVTFSFGPSSGLATQIINGSPADVFAAASDKTMATVTDARAAGTAQLFATNSMEIAVPPDNPAKIDSLDDLTAKDVKLAVCQEDVPCGAAATKVFDTAKLTVEPVSLEVDVKAVLTKVELGEVDAGIVYVTDVKAAGSKVAGVEIPADQNATTNYPIAALTEASNPELADAFVDFVLDAESQKILQAQGFVGP